MPLRAIARLIQTMLYARRFFPYYVYNILGGIEDDGWLIHSIPLTTACYHRAKTTSQIACFKHHQTMTNANFSSTTRYWRSVFI